jgi:hypothetical protein
MLNKQDVRAQGFFLLSGLTLAATQMSTPDCMSRVAQVWRSVCGVTTPSSPAPLTAALVSSRMTRSGIDDPPYRPANFQTKCFCELDAKHLCSPPRSHRGERSVIALHLVAGIIWGSLAARFIVQNFTSLGLAVIYLSGFLFSPVSKSRNAQACLVMVAQSLVFLVLFFGGNWLANKYLDYDASDAIPIASLVSFFLMIVYGVVQVPGKLLLATLCARQPFFAEAALLAPDPVAFAWQFQKSKVKARP